MTPEQRAELRRMCEGITPRAMLVRYLKGRRKDFDSQTFDAYGLARVQGYLRGIEDAVDELDDDEKSRTALPALLDYVEKLEGEAKASEEHWARCLGKSTPEERLRWCYPEIDTMDREQVVQALTNELNDVSMLCDHVTEVYCAVSAGKVSKPQTLPSVVIEMYEHEVSELEGRVEELEFDAEQLEALRAQNYRITVTIEATAPAAAHGYCGKGSTVAEAVRSLGEMMNKTKLEQGEKQ